MGTPDPGFGLHHRVVDGSIILTFRGELDAWADQELSPRIAELMARPDEDIVVDLRQVTFLDAGGLRLLVRIKGQAAARRRPLRLVRSSPRVWRVLRITRLDRSFTVLDGMPAALDASDETDEADDCEGNLNRPA
ncbi:STAS domain-containing protein [Streptomyces sp. NPDC046853]|uniref:STAS domain-containing protein n=1 Tax=unclassified Streptomyces TaxID=2593676 RepID=UPI0033F90086